MSSRLRCGASIALVTGLVLSFSLAGCANRVMKTYDYVAHAQVAINDARRAGADDSAPHVLRHAVELFYQAKHQLDRDQFEAARRSAEEARSLAELAATLARADQSDQDVERLQREIAGLDAG